MMITHSNDWTNHFDEHEQRNANAGTRFDGVETLIPYIKGQRVVERVGLDRYLSAIIFSDDDVVHTEQGYFYDRLTGRSIGTDGSDGVRSIISPHHVQRGNASSAPIGAAT